MVAATRNIGGAEVVDSGGGAMTVTPYESAPQATTASQQSQIDALNASIANLGNVIRTIAATTTATLTDKTVLANAALGAIVFNLRSASSTNGQIITVKKIDSGANSVTIDANGSELIDGALTKVITAQWSSFTIQSNGTAWYII